MADLPLEPRLGKMILYSVVLKCLDPVVTVACALAYRDPCEYPRSCDIQIYSSTYRSFMVNIHKCLSLGTDIKGSNCLIWVFKPRVGHWWERKVINTPFFGLVFFLVRKHRFSVTVS